MQKDHKKGNRHELCESEVGSDLLIKEPDEKLLAAIAFQRARVEIAHRQYDLALKYLNDGWLQKKYFEAAFLNGRIKTLKPDSSEIEYLEGVGEMLEGCYAHMGRQLLKELRDTLENGVKRGIIHGNSINPDNPEAIKRENGIALVHDIMREILHSKKSTPVPERLSALLAELRILFG